MLVEPIVDFIMKLSCYAFIAELCKANSYVGMYSLAKVKIICIFQNLKRKTTKDSRLSSIEEIHFCCNHPHSLQSISSVCCNFDVLELFNIACIMLN